jgi:di/tricarboxylate transporter
MASEQRAQSSTGNWFLLWGMCLLAVWMSPAPPDTALKVNFVRVALALAGVYTLFRAVLWQRSGEPARALAGFVRGAGAFVLAAGLTAANAKYVIESTPLRVAVLAVAGVCLLSAFAIDRAREAPRA